MPATQEAVHRVKIIRNCDKLIEEAQEEVLKAHRNVMRLTRYRTDLQHGAPTEETTKKVFVRKCPFENCKGFLSTRWKCQICENTVCPDCNEVTKETEHVCDPGAVETIALLKKDTKPCPSCGTMIFKISGCSQMWCPDCHTAFDWNTMQIEHGKIHNPHYYEFQRFGGNGGREHGDIPCGGMPSVYEIRKFGINIQQLHRLVNHIEGVELRAHQVIDNIGLRIKYMMNELEEDRFKSILQKNEKAREKARDIANIFRMFCDVVGDHLRQLVLNQVTMDEFMMTIERLREYTNDVFKKVHMRYNCRVPLISHTWSTIY